MKNFNLEFDRISTNTITAEELTGKNIENLYKNLKTIQEKNILQARYRSLILDTKNYYFKWNLKEKIHFLSLYEFKYFGGTSGKWIKRLTPLNEKVLYTNLKKLIKG